jgi:hypothetical protein
MSSVWEQTGLLASGLMVRWSMKGHNFGAAQATRIATLLVENGISNVMDIDYIQWTVEKSLMYGFNHKDTQLLVGAQIQCKNEWYSLMHSRDAEKSFNASFIRRDVIREMVEFDLAKWCAAQPKVGDLPPDKNKFTPVRQVLRPPQEEQKARNNDNLRANKLLRRMSAMHKKVINDKVIESPVLIHNQSAWLNLIREKSNKYLTDAGCSLPSTVKRLKGIRTCLKMVNLIRTKSTCKGTVLKMDRLLIKPFPNGEGMLNCSLLVSSSLKDNPSRLMCGWLHPMLENANSRAKLVVQLPLLR